MSASKRPAPTPQSLLPFLAIKPQSTHTYTATFPQEFCIGTVPHGGYISSIFQAVASKHFSTTLKSQFQPDTIILSLNFLRRTAVGSALFRVKDVKLGRQTSVIHVSLLQGGEGWDPNASDAKEKAVEEVTGYITHTNLDTESGLTVSTGWSLTPAPAPTAFSQDSTTGPGASWEHIPTLPFSSFRLATSHIDLWMPIPSIRSSLPDGRVDQWVRMKTGEPWTNLHLGYLADYFPLLIEFMESPPSSTPGKTVSKRWYPTCTLNLDIKCRLPEQGVEWLGISAQMRNIKNGRDDIEIVIWNQAGDVVAISHHVNLIVDVSRNVGGRRMDRVNVVGDRSKI